MSLRRLPASNERGPWQRTAEPVPTSGRKGCMVRGKGGDDHTPAHYPWPRYPVRLPGKEGAHGDGGGDGSNMRRSPRSGHARRQEPACQHACS